MGLASKTFQVIDVPEPTGYSVEFQYFGYDVEESIAKKADTMQVRLTWSQITDTSEFGSGLLGVTLLLVSDNTAVVEQLSAGSVLDESIAVENFTNFLLQDYYVAEKSVELLESAAAGFNVDIENLAPVDGSSAILSSIVDDGLAQESTVGVSVSDEILSAILQQKFLNESLDPVGVSVGETLIGSMAGIQHINGVDSRVAKDVARAAVKNPFGSFAGNISYMVDDLTSDQQTARNNEEDENTISTAFYEYEITPIAAHEPQLVAKLGEAIVIGYFIEKFEIDGDGLPGETSSFFIPQLPDSSPGVVREFIDEEIKVATTYSYSISTVAIARIPSAQVGSDDSEDVQDVDVVMKSRVQTSVITTGVGYPPAPQDITFTYDASSERLLIQWDFGDTDVNTTKFQVFKRNNITEPYSLIRQYDFDNSIAVADQMEHVDFGLNVRLDKALLYYIDEEFVEGREYIYALCSVNSDGASSPYSAQYSVRYDTVSAALEIRQVSVANAPKPYPNMYLEADLTRSIGKVSDASKLDVYFTPEVLNVTRNEYDPIETDVVIDTIIMDFLKELGPLRDTGKYQLELTELGTFQNSLVEIKLASDDLQILDEFDNPIPGQFDQGLILDPTSV